MREPEITLAEVAARLRLSELTLRRFLRRIGFTAIQGGDTLLFTEADYVTIREARRKCRSRSSLPGKENPQITGSEGLSVAAISTRPQELRAGSLPKRSASNVRRNFSKRASSEHGQVVHLTRQP